MKGNSATRRFLTGVAMLSIAAAGTAWSGCGGEDTEDQLDEASQEINEALDQAERDFREQTEEAQQQADEAFEESGLDAKEGDKAEDSSSGGPGGY